MFINCCFFCYILIKKSNYSDHVKLIGIRKCFNLKMFKNKTRSRIFRERVFMNCLIELCLIEGYLFRAEIADKVSMFCDFSLCNLIVDFGRTGE